MHWCCTVIYSGNEKKKKTKHITTRSQLPHVYIQFQQSFHQKCSPHPHHATKSTSTPRYQIDIHTTLPNPHAHHATKSASTPRYQIHIHTTLSNPHPHRTTKSTSRTRYYVHIHTTLPNPHPHPQHATKSTSTTRYQIHIHNTLSHRSIVESAHNCQEGQTQSLKRSGPPSLC